MDWLAQDSYAGSFPATLVAGVSGTEPQTLLGAFCRHAAALPE
jgi:hypothetical protein